MRAGRPVRYPERRVTEAKYWTKLDQGRVECELCPQRCRIPDEGHGICLGRVNRDGTLYADNYGQCVTVSMDPVEKKPLFHFCPGRQVLSVACNGCNLRCEFCQNWMISQAPAATDPLSPEELVRAALKNDSFGIAYTYTEPLVWFEYILDTGALAHEQGLKNILVTNGVINEEPLLELLPVIDAMNVDLKSMHGDFYKRYCHVDGSEAARRTIQLAATRVHLEVTNLIIPGLNDSDDELREMVGFLADISPSIPLHISRYFPTNKMKIPATPIETLERAYGIAREKLQYIYLGNADRSAASEDTCCPKCGHVLVSRTGYATDVGGVSNGACGSCGRETDFVWCD